MRHMFSDKQLTAKTIADVNKGIEEGKIEVGGGGTEVIANPTLEGTEDVLTGLQVGNTKYAVDGGTKLYKHIIGFRTIEENPEPEQDPIINYYTLTFISARATPYGLNTSAFLLLTSALTDNRMLYGCQPILEGGEIILPKIIYTFVIDSANNITLNGLDGNVVVEIVYSDNTNCSDSVYEL